MDTRDPERIAPLLDLLGAVWREHPDWQLGQLLGNVVDTHGAEPEMSNLFYVKDDVIAAGLVAMTTVRRAIGGELARARSASTPRSCRERPSSPPRATARPQKGKRHEQRCSRRLRSRLRQGLRHGHCALRGLLDVQVSRLRRAHRRPARAAPTPGTPRRIRRPVPARARRMIGMTDKPFVPLLCRLRLHRWRVATGRLKGTCACARCYKLKGPGA